MKLHRLYKSTTKEFDLTSRDGRKQYFLTFDTETIGIEEKFIYDLGFAIHDKQGNIIYKRNFVIKEVFDNMKLMQRAYYGEKKYQSYVEKIEKGKIEKVSLSTALRFLRKILHEYTVDIICAYSIFFDITALYDTYRHVILGYIKPVSTNKKARKTEKTEISYFQFCLNYLIKNVFGKEIKCLDIYGMACEIILTQKTYIETAIKNQWFTQKGNILTNAECAYRYITGDMDFIESHTALDDVLIEIQILKKCFNAHKKYTRDIIHMPYKIVKNRREALAI